MSKGVCGQQIAEFVLYLGLGEAKKRMQGHSEEKGKQADKRYRQPFVPRQGTKHGKVSLAEEGSEVRKRNLGQGVLKITSASVKQVKPVRPQLSNYFRGGWLGPNASQIYPALG